MGLSDALNHRGRAHSGADKDHTVGEGIIIALADHPTFVILRDDGTHLHWAAHLVEVGDPVPEAEYKERVAASLADRDELERLRKWKREATPLFDGLQDLGRALELPLGVLVTGPLALEAANKLRAERDMALAAAESNR